MKKLTAKDLLKEVQSMRKQAGSLAKPYPIEYEDEADLETSIDSALLDILDGFGYLGATEVIVKGDTAYVKVQGELELDVKQIFSWWDDPETNWNKVTAEIVKGLGRGWEGEYYKGVWRIWRGTSEDWDDMFDLNTSDPSDQTLVSSLIVSRGKTDWEDLVLKKELSEYYSNDIAFIVKAIKNI